MKSPIVSALRTVIAALAIGCAVSSVSAADKAPSEKVLKKYDLNKDGKLDEAETAKWHADQKAAAEKKAAEKKAAAETPAK